MPPKHSVKERIKIIERVLLRGIPVSQVCAEAEISRVLFYRWLHKYQEGDRDINAVTPGRDKEENVSFGKPLEKYHKFSPQEKLKLVERVVKSREEVADICREAGISRTIFYRWKRRYEEALPEERQQALSRQPYQTAYHWRRKPAEYEQAVLNLVARHPEYGIRKLLVNLPQVAGESIVSHHGLQNILHRHHLSLYEQRLVYAQAQVSSVDRLASVFKETFGRLFALAPSRRGMVVRFTFATALSTFTTIVFLGILGYFVEIAPVVFLGRPGLVFATIALSAGMVFFFYSMKYYFMLTLVLSFSSRSVGISAETKNEQNTTQGTGLGWLMARVIGISDSDKSSSAVEAGGLMSDLDHIKPERYPFISVQLPFYNEKKVASRIISACTSMDYPNFEVIICDDSNDETVKIVNSWVSHPRVKVLRRNDRKGFKGGALSRALKVMNPRTEFVVVFDADFIPYPDTLIQFVKYFKATGGWEEKKDYRVAGIRTVAYDTNKQVEVSPEEQSAINNQQSTIINKSDIAVVAGYQWHVLNKSENWITKGVRTEYAGSYVIERPAQEILGAMKVIHGSVYCMRADVLKHFGWGTSITEDYELTLRLYACGFKVIFTPYIQAPSECVSTIKGLIRQRMRWAEGHSFNTKKMFGRLLFGHWEEGKVPKVSNVSKGEKAFGTFDTFPSFDTSKRWQPSPLTWSEKLEFLYLAPYYLQAFFFLIGTFAWIISETIFPARLPFWTALWGWSLILTNFLALPLVNAIGLFLEESEEKDYLGLLSFIVLSYIVVPFQAYAAIKGFIEPREETWFRTPKTGRITDAFARGRFYRWLLNVLPGLKPAVGRIVSSKIAPLPAANAYLSLGSSNNRFNDFKISPRRVKWVAEFVLVLLLVISVTLMIFTREVPEVLATSWENLYIHEDNSLAGCSSADSMTTSTGVSATAITISDTNQGPFYWYSPQLPTGDDDGNMGAGPWTFRFTGSYVSGGNGSNIVVAHALSLVDASNCANPTTEDAASFQFKAAAVPPQSVSITLSNNANTAITSSAPKRVRLRLQYVSHNKAGTSVTLDYDGGTTDTNDANLQPSTLTVPENGLLLAVSLPFVIGTVFWMRKRKDIKMLRY